MMYHRPEDSTLISSTKKKKKNRFCNSLLLLSILLYVPMPITTNRCDSAEGIGETRLVCNTLIYVYTVLR